MEQLVKIKWYSISVGETPSEQGTYLVAWDDGTVESYPFDSRDIQDGQVKSGRSRGVYWAEPIPHPDA